MFSMIVFTSMKRDKLIESKAFLFINVIYICPHFSSALQQEVAETESQGDIAFHLPPCNRDADKPENVYEFENRILFNACFE